MDKYALIKESFENNANPENAIAMSKYMKNKFVFYGIPSPERKELYKEFIKSEKKKKQLTGIFLINAMKTTTESFSILHTTIFLR